jgi:hypothetical protein
VTENSREKTLKEFGLRRGLKFFTGDIISLFFPYARTEKISLTYIPRRNWDSSTPYPACEYALGAKGGRGAIGFLERVLERIFIISYKHTVHRNQQLFDLNIHQQGKNPKTIWKPLRHTQH